MIDFKQEIFLMSPYHVIAALGMTKVLEKNKDPSVKTGLDAFI